MLTLFFRQTGLLSGVASETGGREPWWCCAVPAQSQGLGIRTLVDGGSLRPRTVCCGLPQHSPLSRAGSACHPGLRWPTGSALLPSFFTCFHCGSKGSCDRLTVCMLRSCSLQPNAASEVLLHRRFAHTCTAPTVRARDKS